MRMLGRRLRRELPPVRGVSRSAVQVLRVVARGPEPSPSDVAEKLRMTSSNVAGRATGARMRRFGPARA